MQWVFGASSELCEPICNTQGETFQHSAIRSASLELTSGRGGRYLLVLRFTATEPSYTTCLLGVQNDVLTQADGNHHKGTVYFTVQE
jgi:hypothetical protein